MADQDPFQDQAFLGRLGKLLALLASEQPGEAEAARRKLIDHLSQARLSLSDLANHMAVTPPPGLSFTGAPREVFLERELRASRLAHAETQAELRATQQRAYDAEVLAQQTAIDLERAGAGSYRLRTITVAASIAAVLCIMVLVVRSLPSLAQHDRALTHTYVQPSRMVPADPVAEAQRHPAGQRLGTVAVQDLAVRFDPSDQAGVRTFLNEGAKVVIVGQAREGSQTWLQVRSESGEGWVRSGDVLH